MSESLEKQLQFAQNRFTETADLFPGVICEIDTDLRVRYVNKSGLALFGFSQADLDAGIYAFSIFKDIDQANAKQDFINILSGDYANPKEYALKRTDGSPIFAVIRARPIIEDGVPKGIRCCLTDISTDPTRGIKFYNCISLPFRQSLP